MTRCVVVSGWGGESVDEETLSDSSLAGPREEREPEAWVGLTSAKESVGGMLRHAHLRTHRRLEAEEGRAARSLPMSSMRMSSSSGRSYTATSASSLSRSWSS